MNINIMSSAEATFPKSTGSIPVIDFSHLSLIHAEISHQRYREMGQELHEAFETWGFAYVANHGIPADIIEECMAASRDFFQLPVETKKKYRSVK